MRDAEILHRAPSEMKMNLSLMLLSPPLWLREGNRMFGIVEFMSLERMARLRRVDTGRHVIEIGPQFFES